MPLDPLLRHPLLRHPLLRDPQLRDPQLRDTLRPDPLLHTPDRAGILYAEDFDGPPAPPASAPPPAPEPLEPSFSSGEMEVARQLAAEAAVARAQAEWDASEARARTHALAAIAAELAAAQEDARVLVEAAADGTVRAVLGMAAGLLPAYCAGHGGTEVRRLLAHLLPALQQEPRVTVRCNPAVAEAVRADLLLLDGDMADRVAVVPSGLAPGDVRVAWADGSLVRDGAAIHAAMVAALAELGLVDPDAIPAGPQPAWPPVQVSVQGPVHAAHDIRTAPHAPLRSHAHAE